MTDITPIIVAIITLIGSVITVYVVPYIKSKLKESDRENLEQWVEIATRAAEQLYISGELKTTGMSRKEYVINFLEKKGFTIDMDQIVTLIESCVYYLPSTSRSIKEKTNEDETTTSGEDNSVIHEYNTTLI